MIFLGLLVGTLAGTPLGALNGLLAAALLTRKPQPCPPLRPRRFAAFCAAVNFCGLGLFLVLLFETDGFSNFSLSPASHAGPNHTINIISDKSTFLLLVVGPALVAAAAAFWASARLAEWYQDETSPPQNSSLNSDTSRAMDHLWPL